MTEIMIKNLVYRCHPIYKMYAASKFGIIMNIRKQIPSYGTLQKRDNCLKINVRKYGDSNQKSITVQKFVWECFNGIVPDNMIIIHKNNVKHDNRLENLACTIHQIHQKRVAEYRDYSHLKNIRHNPRTVKMIDIETGSETIYNSLHKVQKHHGINSGQIKMICEGFNNCNTARSKIDGKQCTFEYF